MKQIIEGHSSYPQEDYPQEFDVRHLREPEIGEEAFKFVQNYIHDKRFKLHKEKEVSSTNETIEEIRRRVQDHIIDITTVMSEQDMNLFDVYEKRSNKFRKYLVNKYGTDKVNNIMLFHDVFGSTPYGVVDKLDFEEEDSIQSFVYDPFNPDYDFEAQHGSSEDLFINKTGNSNN